MDELDKNIIFELEKNGRTTSIDISKKLGVSNLTIARRMRIMLQEDKTVKVMGVPDPAQIGWLCNAVVVLKCDYGKVDAVLSSLKEVIYINHMVTLIGECSVLALMAAESWDKILEQFNIIRRTEGVLAMDTYCTEKTHKRFIFGGDGFSFGVLKAGARPYPLDDVDTKIIRALLDDGRVSYAKLAEQIAEPLSVVRRRASQLFDHDVVKVRPIIDLNFMMAVQIGVFVFLNMRQEFIAANVKTLKKCDEIVIIQTLTNNADIMFLLQGTKPEPVYSVLKELLDSLKGIIGVKSYFRSGIVKRYYSKDLKSELKSFALEGKKDIDVNGH